MDTEWNELVKKFVGSFGARVQALSEVVSDLKQGDAVRAREKLIHISHKISGVAGSYGFRELSECAAEIEERLDAGESDVRWMEVAALRLRGMMQDVATQDADQEAPEKILKLSARGTGILPLHAPSAAPSWRMNPRTETLKSSPALLGEQILVFGLSFYGVSTFISMATMSIGVAVFVVCLLVYGNLAAISRLAKLDSRLDQNMGSNFAFGEILAQLRGFWGVREFRWLCWASCSLTVSCVLSLVGARFFPLIYHGYVMQVHWLQDMAKAWYLFWPFPLAIAISLLSREGKIRVLRYWWGAFALLCCIGVVQYFTGWPRMQRIPGNESRFHTILFFGHHLSTASILIFPFFLQLELLFKKTLPKPLAWFVLGIAAFTLFGTYSRTLWIVLPIGILIWILWRLPKKWRPWVVAAGVIFALVLSQVSWIQSRMTDSLGVYSRQSLWESNWRFFLERPLTGVGWHQNHQLAYHYLAEKHGWINFFVGHAHNMVLEMLGSTGLLGALSWLAWVGIWLAMAWRSARQGSVFGRAMVCAWIVFQLNGLTQVNFWDAKVLHQVMWVVAWLLVMQKPSEREEQESWLS